MLDIAENTTEVRKNWSDFVDQVSVRKIPKVVARNKKNPFFSVSLEQLATMLHAYRFDVVVEKEEDHSLTVTLDDFDLVANGETLELALSSLAEDLIEYSQEYIDEIQTYYSAPNRKQHLPYVLAVLMKDNTEQVVSLFNADIPRY